MADAVTIEGTRALLEPGPRGRLLLVLPAEEAASRAGMRRSSESIPTTGGLIRTTRVQTFIPISTVLPLQHARLSHKNPQLRLCGPYTTATPPPWRWFARTNGVRAQSDRRAKFLTHFLWTVTRFTSVTLPAAELVIEMQSDGTSTAVITSPLSLSAIRRATKLGHVSRSIDVTKKLRGIVLCAVTM